MKKVKSNPMLTVILMCMLMVIYATPILAGPQQYGGVLKIACKSPPSAPLGYKPEVSYAFWAVIPCVETLVTPDEKGRPSPMLATSWENAPDLSSITFKLRKGVKFHDGTDFNAEAVKWNLDQLQAHKRWRIAQITSVDVIDQYTVRVNLKEWTNNILTIFFVSGGTMFSPTATQKNGIEWAKNHPVGTGPFKFKKMVKDVTIEYEKFEGYWRKGKPYLDGIKYVFMKEPMVVSAAIQAGEVDMTWGSTTVTAKIASELETKGFKVARYMSAIRGLIGDSTNPDSPFAKKTVREAIDYAIDNKAIVKKLGHGQWSSLDQMAYITNSESYNSNIKPREYNPEKAKQLLVKAGYPDGFSTKIYTTPRYTSKDALVVMQSNLADIGIKAEIETSRQGWVRAKYGGWEQGSMMVMMLVNEPHYIYVLERELDHNNHAYKNLLRPAGYKDLMKGASSAADFETIQAKTKAMVKLLHDEAVVAPLWITPTISVQAPYIHGTSMCEFHYYCFTPWDAWISK